MREDKSGGAIWMGMMHKTIGLATVLALCGCAGLRPQTCPQGLKPAKTAELFFGRNIGAQEGVDDVQWRTFVTREIAPRFADGFTVSDATGAWQGPGGEAVRERTKRVFIVLTGAPDEQRKLAAIRAAYRQRFRQGSVMLIEGAGCVGF